MRGFLRLLRWSPSSRRVWIEIAPRGEVRSGPPVTLLAEGVDRNHLLQFRKQELEEVTLLAEGVDRNAGRDTGRQGRRRSPSSRRVWIEIFASVKLILSRSVTLLAEGVDRNIHYRLSQRAKNVTLLAEGVDRNWL